MIWPGKHLTSKSLWLCAGMAICTLAVVVICAVVRWQTQAQQQAVLRLRHQQQSQSMALQQQWHWQVYLAKHAIAQRTLPWLSVDRLREMHDWQVTAQLPPLQYARVNASALSASLQASTGQSLATGMQVEYWQVSILARQEADSLRWLNWLQWQVSGSLLLRECVWSPTDGPDITTRCLLEWAYAASKK